MKKLPQKLPALLLVLALAGAGPTAPGPASAASSPTSPVSTTSVSERAVPAAGQKRARLAKVRARILGEVNDYRVEADLPALKAMRGLNTVALAWTKKMARAQEMSHNPDYSTQIPDGWTRAGENVAYGYAPARVTAAWFASPGHRANMLGDYTHIGIGWALDDGGTPYYTQNFASY